MRRIYLYFRRHRITGAANILEKGEIMMKWIKKGMLVVMVLLCMSMLSACSFKETLGILWNGENKEDTGKKEETQQSEDQLQAADIDENVEKPVIANELGEPVTYGLNAEAEPMTVEASVSDGGTLSYQWYRNNVDSNGGGTEIEGAVENSFTPGTSEPGTTYYYVVVTNTVGTGIQLTTSLTKCVTVTEEEILAPEETEEAPEAVEEPQQAAGTWKESENGWWYEYADGTYPTAKWEQIDGEWYAFDENGYIRKGWYQEGDKWYYLNENGTMARDTDVDGYHLGSDGVMQ